MFVSCVAVAVPAGCADDSTHTTPNVADTVAVSTTIPVSTTTVVADTTGPASEIVAEQSIDLETGTLHYTVPSDAAVDPRPMPTLPPFVIGYSRWTTDCCQLKITVQDVNPPMPPDEVVGTFTSGGMQWTIYDTGPRDGTEALAMTTGPLGTIIVGTQARFPQSNGDPTAARTLAETVARTVSAG